MPSHRTTQSRILLGVSILPLLVALLAGCSGDDEPAPTSADTPPPGEQVVACKAEVDASGDADADWQGKAQVNLRNADDEGPGPEARYTTGNGKSDLSIFSTGPDFRSNITLSVGGVAYSSGEDPKGLNAKADGSRVKAEGVELTGPQNATATLRALITCKKPDQE